MSTSGEVAAALVSVLHDGGVREVVLAPGSRSAALAIALFQADADGLIRLHVRIDERTAGFLALGLAKGSRRPVAVVTTSGTAVANLHPAVLEASHAGERLLVVSADRPAALRGTGANQTTEQHGIFGPRVPSFDLSPGDIAGMRRAAVEAVSRRGPTQLNLQFADPLLPAGLPLEFPARPAPGPGAEEAGRRRHSNPGQADDATVLEAGPKTVVVAGDDAGPPARLLAQRAGWPLLAEPTSGARTGTHAIRTYRLLLTGELGDQIERVVVAGHPTLSRPVTRLISRPDVEVWSVRGPGGVCTDPGLVARHLDTVPVVAESDETGWLDAWRRADEQLSEQVDVLAAGPQGSALRVAAEVAAAVTPGALLVTGSSQPVRDLDVMAQPYPVGERRLIIGNRGLAGIDGTLSTAIGAALGRQSPRALAYVGDLTFLHDANALVRSRSEPTPALTIVVVNDDGGAIFSTLEQGAQMYAESFDRVFGTPHGVSIRAMCEATATAYERADDSTTLRDILAVDPAGIRVVEVPLNRGERRSLDSQLRALV